MNSRRRRFSVPGGEETVIRDSASARLRRSPTIPVELIDQLAAALARDGYGPRQRSKWIEEGFILLLQNRPTILTPDTAFDDAGNTARAMLQFKLEGKVSADFDLVRSFLISSAPLRRNVVSEMTEAIIMYRLRNTDAFPPLVDFSAARDKHATTNYEPIYTE